MTFEEYWNKRTLDDGDVIASVWIAQGHIGNKLYHFLKDFAKEIWNDAQKETPTI